MTGKLWVATLLIVVAASALSRTAASTAGSASQPVARKIEMQPIGAVHKKDGAAWIEIDRRFQDGLLGIGDFSHVWVLWWFDRSDTPAKRRILQVHPRGDERNPLTGVFATRSPVRPNPIALSLCKVKAVERNVLRVEDIDAFDGTPVIDLKPYLPGLDRVEEVRLPHWATRK